MTQPNILSRIITCILSGMDYSNIEGKNYSLVDEMDEDLEYADLDLVEKDLL